MTQYYLFVSTCSKSLNKAINYSCLILSIKFDYKECNNNFVSMFNLLQPRFSLKVTQLTYLFQPWFVCLLVKLPYKYMSIVLPLLSFDSSSFSLIKWTRFFSDRRRDSSRFSNCLDEMRAIRKHQFSFSPDS